MKKAHLLAALKDLIKTEKHKISAVPLNTSDMKKSLEILKHEYNFDKFKKDFYSLRDSFAEKTNLSQEQATSLINYALHVQDMP